MNTTLKRSAFSAAIEGIALRYPRHPLQLALGSLCAMAAAPLLAQTGTTATLTPVIITGNPLGATDFIAPAVQYSGPELTLRAQSTLGATLDGSPGVSSTYFGPNANRPVIRGLDGDRIRILSNGGVSTDVSSLSYDHAVTADPLSIERIEVLRGAAALQYGGSAVGGVVNLIDNRIPREPLFDAQGGVAGKLDLGLGSGNRERSEGMLLEAGNARYALHADGFNRNTADVAVPRALACSKPGAPALANRICNSASHSEGGAIGGSLFFDQGYLGASASSYRSQYGTVAEDDVTINMNSERYALEGELRGLTGPLQSLKGQLSHSDYAHTELNAGVAGTVFKSQGDALRLEGRHVRLGALEGMVGLQSEVTDFSATGDEAFAPFSRTDQHALFAYEELPRSWGKLSFGARAESVRVESFGNPQVARFTAGSRSFNPHSYALGGLWQVAPAWQLTSNLAYSQRAPKDYELFANGPHLATGVYEVGDADFSPEKSTNLDAGVAWKQGANSAGLSAFVNHFPNYIAQLATGNRRGTDAELNPVDADNNGEADGSGAKILPEYRYAQVQARFTGLEAKGKLRLLEAGQTLDLELRGDLVRADNLTAGEPLPRIAPLRAGASLVWGRGPWGARLGFDHSAAQTRVPAGQLATAGYTLWNASMNYRMKAGATQMLWFARLDNIGDTLAYSASSILTQTAAGKVPLPGRSLKLGLQASF
ncbi:MAG: TonB-dependent receptor [Gammaproteobacteria bacterium]|nr:TonB-dependent receptor [Gammaproteobacteria bacterium]MBU0787893.1 TonB-dependent receptor [Gammaproteobacteria bacterium]MBU0816990.1 TonB-dependent receptor [Gammaproteobacteria bacterium]MBU1787154.1 TonB-dependent receptor [Gammaproteobacteria bacterium]